MSQQNASSAQTVRHPRQLYLLFFTEMWERFSFYGMKALLLAYMVTQLSYEEPKGYAILGAYAALVYTMPMFGGMLADRLLGYQRAILFGGVLMAAGHLVLAIPEDWSFFLGMALIICGNGFFKPNISSIVGQLYDDNDPRKDSAFSIFYMGINIGAALGGALCGWVAGYNWHYGFGLAGLFMILGLVVFLAGRASLGDKGLAPDPVRLKKPFLAGLSLQWSTYLLSLLAVPVVVFLLRAYTIMDYIMLPLGVLSLCYLVWVAFRLEPEGRGRMLAATVMIIFSVLFWAFYEQNSGALNLFAMRNVDMHVLGVELPALAVNNFLPPAWVILLSPVFAWLWVWLSRRRMEPGTPVKFALSFLLVGAGFLVFFAGTRMSADTGLIPLYLFAGGYFFIISGELCISPIGLSMITKLSPGRMVGMMMGIWFLASALGEFLASKIGALMSVPESEVLNPVSSLPYYSTILQQIGYSSAGVGVLLLLLVPILRRWMSGIH
jgi:POT family proton-dependent oligopeptide transporter